MSTDTQPLSITATTTVEVPIEEAFRFFTEEISAWWNPDHHIIEAPLSHMVFEPFVGGNVYDVGTDGSECRWSRVLVYDRPHRVVFSWDIDSHWSIETDPARCSEVEVDLHGRGPDDDAGGVAAPPPRAARRRPRGRSSTGCATAGRPATSTCSQPR